MTLKVGDSLQDNVSLFLDSMYEECVSKFDC